MAKKSFFQEQTKAQIKRKREVHVPALESIADLNEDEFAVLESGLLVPRGYDSARKFMKHGPEVKPKRVYTLTQAVAEAKTPVQLREEVFNGISGHHFCGYTFMPLGRDQRKRKVPLTECLEGARIFAYASQMGVPIKIKAYSDSKRVRIDGAEVVAEIPSRTEGQRRMQLKLISVPFVDSPEKYAISLNIGSDHSCPSKRFNIRYKYTDDKEGSGIVNLCAHEIAAYLELIQQQWQDSKNIVPLQMCQFAIPTQETVDYYLKWGNNVLIRDADKGKKDNLRKPNRAEREIGLWSLVKALGHDRTFYSTASRDGNVAEYNWNAG